MLLRRAPGRESTSGGYRQADRQLHCIRPCDRNPGREADGLNFTGSSHPESKKRGQEFCLQNVCPDACTPIDVGQRIPARDFGAAPGIRVQ